MKKIAALFLILNALGANSHANAETQEARAQSTNTHQEPNYDAMIKFIQHIEENRNPTTKSEFSLAKEPGKTRVEGDPEFIDIKSKKFLEDNNFEYSILGLVAYDWIHEKGFHHTVNAIEWRESQSKAKEMLEKQFGENAFDGYAEAIDAKAKEFGLTNARYTKEYKDFIHRAYFSSNMFSYNEYIQLEIRTSSRYATIEEYKKAVEEANSKDEKAKKDNCCIVM